MVEGSCARGRPWRAMACLWRYRAVDAVLRRRGFEVVASSGARVRRRSQLSGVARWAALVTARRATMVRTAPTGRMKRVIRVRVSPTSRQRRRVLLFKYQKCGLAVHRTSQPPSRGLNSMQAVLQETSLVIAGAWNPAILTPAWLLQHAVEQPDIQAHMVQAIFPAALNGAFDFPRFTLPGFTYTARNDGMILLPEALNQASLDTIEGVGERILSQLSHTPIGGVGHNFEFRHAPAEDEWLVPFYDSQINLVDAVGGWHVSRITLATSFINGDVNVNVQRYTEGETFVVKFNFHHPVTSAADARRVMLGEGYQRSWQNFQTACGIVEKLYGAVEL